MREERFRIQCPKHFLVGDSGRFEKSPQGKDSDFVVDYAPPEMFEAGIVLQEMGTEGDTYCTMYVYFAPEEHLPVYMDSMKYDLQKVSIRKIFVDTKEYLIKVNEKTKKFYAGEDGCWGSYTELYRKENGERLTDAVIVFLCMPDEMKFQEMEAVMGELFEKLPVIDKEKKETGQELLWSSIFVTLMANKIGGLQFGIYRNCQISSRVFHTAVAALPLTKANRSDFE